MSNDGTMVSFAIRVNTLLAIGSQELGDCLEGCLPWSIWVFAVNIVANKLPDHRVSNTFTYNPIELPGGNRVGDLSGQDLGVQSVELRLELVEATWHLVKPSRLKSRTLNSPAFSSPSAHTSQ